MSKEQLNPYQNPFELLSKMPPERFSEASDSLVDFQISQQLLLDINKAVEDGELVAIITPHQSYHEIESERRFCQELNKISSKPIETYLTYSAPAVGLNIGNFFELRKPIYDECHLNMLGVIREIDRVHPKYQKNITPEMEKENISNFKTLAKAILKGGCVIIIPLEGTLNSGRINPETGKINGLQATDTDVALTRMVKKGAIFVPCGIDGSYKVLDPNNHLPTAEFIKAFSSPPTEKLVTFKTDKLIDPSKEYPGKTTPEICHQIIIEVARRVSFYAQGRWTEFVK